MLMNDITLFGYLFISALIAVATLEICTWTLNLPKFKAVTFAFINFFVWPIAIPLELLLLILGTFAKRIR